MKTFSAFFLFSVLILAASCGDDQDKLIPSVSQVTGATNSVSVRVLNMQGDPVNGATVWFNSTSMERQEEEGNVFTFSGLANGDYSVAVSAPDFDSRTIWMEPVRRMEKDGVTYGMLSFKNIRLMPSANTLSFTKERVANAPSIAYSNALLEMDMTIIVPEGGVTGDKALLFTPFYGKDGIGTASSIDDNEEIFCGLWVHDEDGRDNRNGVTLPKGDTVNFKIPECLKPYVSLKKLDRNGLWMLPEVNNVAADVVQLIVDEPAYYALFFQLEKEETMTGESPLVFSPASKAGPSVTKVHEFTYKYNDNYSLSLTSLSGTAEDIACKTWLKSFITRQHAAETTSERTGYVRTTAVLSAGMVLTPLGWQQQKTVTYKAFGWKATVDETGTVYVGTKLSNTY